MTVQKQIEAKLETAFSPTYLNVQNESSQHNVPPGSESHFKVIVVSEQFEKKRLMEQHQQIHQVLKEELAGPVHALSIQTSCPSKWNKGEQKVYESPPCLGGGTKR
ncbi:MAG: BolA/IbaG family iron-sulfur metabolism protein [SAR324 cluster bacterium]|nr:BolA/IbaG family iron-sulfur metabolism protein [SAR324 cluster bacterium]